MSLATLMAAQLVHIGPPIKAPGDRKLYQRPSLESRSETGLPDMAKKRDTYRAVVFFVAKKMAKPVATIGAAIHRNNPRFLIRMDMYGNYEETDTG